MVKIACDIEARRGSPCGCPKAAGDHKGRPYAPSGVYRATPEELDAIDEALEQVARGELASKEEIEAAFASYRRA